MSFTTRRETLHTILISHRRVAIFLVGTPGSGKTTFASQYRGQLRIINADDIMVTILKGKHLRQPQVTAKVYPHAEKLARRQLHQSMIWGKSFLHDDTGVDVTCNRAAILEAKRNGYFVVLAFIQAPLHVCLQRNRQRERYVCEKRVVEIHQQMVPISEELSLLADCYEVISTCP